MRRYEELIHLLIFGISYLLMESEENGNEKPEHISW
jgi:hypothetical protein